MSNFDVEILKQNDTLSFKFSGELDYKNAKKTTEILRKALSYKGRVEFDFARLSRVDYACAILLRRAIKTKDINIKSCQKSVEYVFLMLDDDKIDYTYKVSHNNLNLFEQLGKRVIEGFLNVVHFACFMGEFIVKIFFMIIKPTKLRLRELSNYVKDAGVDAVFIVSLTAFLIGIVLAYLGSSMLVKFGASIFIVEIMGMLTLREVAPLIAAIVIAGRSASSFTAQIGAMKITEEIDAMKTMGFDPFNFLVLPRVIAMMICVPLIIFIADIVGIFGQMIVCENLLDISFASYLGRFKEMVDIRHFLVGMIKAPFFGIVIAIIGCMRGFGVSQNAQSLGEMTTLSVVNAIFWVIALDAFFAVLFMWIGL